MVFKDIGQMMIDARGLFTGLQELIPAFAAVVGAVFIIQGFLRVRKLADHNPDATIGGVFASFIVGGLLIQYAQYQLLASDIFGLDAGASYMADTGSKYMDDVIDAVLFGVKVMGMYGMFSALMDAKKAGEGQNSGGDDLASSAFWKFVGGAAAVNLSSFLN